jgi:sulfide:quinone oxidoreductase
MTTEVRHQVLIIGGGTAGITVAARLRRAAPNLEIGIVEPSGKHYYQPLWTLVGGGVMDKSVTEREEADYIPAGVTWLRNAVTEIDPEKNQVVLDSGQTVSYEWLIPAPGIQINWSAIKGLPEAMGKDGVCSNYSYEHVESTWRFLREVESGNAIFTMPGTPIKCGGAPQKIMWLAQHYLEREGRLANANVMFAAAGKWIFGIEAYRKTLERLVTERNIDTRFRHDLIEVRPASREAIFRRLDEGDEVAIPYSMLHVVPPMGAPDFIARSPIANDGGWVDVDKSTLQHVRYPNIFALGDASSLPTAKTGAAVRKQAPVLVENMLAVMESREPTACYDGYTSCPLITGYGRLVLAEFDYDGNTAETFPFDQSKERWSRYFLKKNILPQMYWRGMLRGRA